ncbi:hypothetical protein PoB_001746100 [Plakobranchus ocellatus]|uniref:HAT C-terminal dimerisation domain-containing protein n=1 Tax=Plakobranchus ocellatus TaxID=259542 RepID=A0AAV3Z8J9_9GAST|nr:hypothetical protein PoB_001746100 [Plakobranchus ocellatus]
MGRGKIINSILKQRGKSDTIRVLFVQRSLAAFNNAGQVLLEKMPLDNDCIMAFSALDPEIRGTTASLLCLNNLAALIPSVVLDEGALDQESRSFQTDKNILPVSGRIEVWWAKLGCEWYVNLAKLVKAALSCFHGPLVESTFSVMGHIVTKNKTNMDVQTYAAYQTIKYHLKSMGKSSIECFAKADPFKDAVCGKLSPSIR